MTETRKPRPEDTEDERSGSTADFGAALEAFERTHATKPEDRGARDAAEPRVGARVNGRVVAIGTDSVLIDIGGRSEAVADAGELRAEEGSLGVEVGQSLEWFVVGTGEQVQLSRTPRAPAGHSLAAVRQAREAGLPVRGRVTSVNKGGLTVDVDGVRAFCPLSQIDETFVADPAPYVGRALEFRVTEVDEAHARVVLSRRQWLKAQQEARQRERIAALAPGQDVEGRVTRLEPFGAFVDLGGVEGLVHVSEISHARLDHARDALAVGESVRARVLRVEQGKAGRPRVSLSIRAGAPDPWADVARRFPVGARVPGVVVRLAEFGAFVNLAPGVDGLVHVSQVSERRIGHVREVLSPGQAVDVTVLAVEPERKRISLSMREPREEAVPRSVVLPPARSSTPAAEPPAVAKDPAVKPKPAAPEPLTPMQLAFQRAREAQRKREERG